MSDKKRKRIKTRLERKIDWFFENCAKLLTPVDFEIILNSEFSKDNSKLVIDLDDLKPRFQDIIELAYKIGKHHDDIDAEDDSSS